MRRVAVNETTGGWMYGLISKINTVAKTRRRTVNNFAS